MVSTMARASLLYVTPVIPALTGNGLAMRAGMVLEALCGSYRVSVLVARLYGSAETAMPDALAALCERWVVSPAADTADAYPGCTFDVVHVFRMAAVPFARPYLQPGSGARPGRHLDLDDIESKVHAKLAQLMRANGDERRAAVEEAEGRRSRMLELGALPFFDRVYVCCEEDRREISVHYRGAVHVLPNAVRLPCLRDPRSPRAEFRFLFVGTFGYYPNQDAAVYFCTRILPLLRGACSGAFGVDLVGSGIPPSVERLALDCGVTVVGTVPDVGPWYQRAGAAIVPIRAGGGTRIKILEAFSYGCPVITTSVGMQGIRAVREEHVLLGDTPEEFALQCRRAMENAHLRSSLADNAGTLLLESYTAEVVRRIVEEARVPS